MADEPDLKFRRRDMIEAEQVAGKPFGQLFQDGIPTALGSLAVQYVLERRNGLTDVDFDVWLDDEPGGVEVEVADPS